MLYFSRWKITTIVLVVLGGLLTTLPNFLSSESLRSWPDFLPAKQVVLGLDLQGGAYLLYEVDKDDYKVKQYQQLEGSIRRALREKPRIGYTGLGVVEGAVQVRIRDAQDVSEARKRLEGLLNPQTTGFGGPSVNEFALDMRDDGLARMTFTEDGLDMRLNAVVAQSIEVIRRRIDELGTTEPSIQKQGSDRILVEAPGESDPQRLKNVIGQTAQMTFHLVDERMSGTQALNGRPPVGTHVVMGAEDNIPYLLDKTPLLTGDELEDAQAAFDQRNNEPVVNFRFDLTGARKFAKVTRENTGRRFAIVLDNTVITAPVIREPITGGSGTISGSFSVQSANDLAVLLRAGALPAKLTVMEERSVGPGLGQDSIEAGKIAALIGAALVVIYMIASYGLFGVFANIALAVNVVLLFAVLTMLQATLTLPGIAGIVLTVGMAVDANVLIFERIREEARAGRSALGSIDAGFQRALGTILDANITTLIAAVILFFIGTGPVKGFSVTLMVGLFTTVFSAFTVSRLLIALWVRRRRPSKLPI